MSTTTKKFYISIIIYFRTAIFFFSCIIFAHLNRLIKFNFTIQIKSKYALRCIFEIHEYFFMMTTYSDLITSVDAMTRLGFPLTLGKSLSLNTVDSTGANKV